MDQEVRRIELVESSFKIIKETSTDFTLKFYQKLFEDAPHFVPLFKNTIIEAQSEKLLDSLVLLVENPRQT